MPIEIALPFRLDDDGAIAVEADPDRQISQHVRTLIATTPGERVMLPTYGTPITRLLFDPDLLVQEEISDLVSAALQVWEPGVLVRRVTPVESDDPYAAATVMVDYVRADAARTPQGLARSVNTAVIRAGGEVREAVRG